ncbi:MAG: class I SAM-dependent methyltransferase [Acidobacteriaceae bacterium]
MLRGQGYVLDAAYGTGVGARLSAQSVTSSGRIVGLDSDPAMIEIARGVTRVVAIPMEWHCASALDRPFADTAFDVCVGLQELQFFPDRAAGFAGPRQIPKLSGRLAASIRAPLGFNKGRHAVVEAPERQKIDLSQAKRPVTFGEPGHIHDKATRARFRKIGLRTGDALLPAQGLDPFVDDARDILLP